MLVITPDFNYENDEGVEIGDAFWNNSRPWGDWRAGAHSSPKSGQYAALRLERLPGKGQIGTSDRRQAAAASAGCPAGCPPSHPLLPPPNCRSRPAARVGQQAGRGMDMAPDPSLTRVRPLLASAQRPHGLVVRGARHLRQPALGDGALPQARCARTAPRPSRRRPCALSWRTRPIVGPGADLISVVGHSAGGQTVQRYALSTALPPAIRTGLALRYVVANPSSYGYLDSTRPVYKCADCPSLCPRDRLTPACPRLAARLGRAGPRAPLLHALTRCGNCDCNTRECDCDAKCTPDGPIHDAALPFVRPPAGFSVADPKQFVCGHAKHAAYLPPDHPACSLEPSSADDRPAVHLQVQ